MPRILIIDDDPDFRYACRLCLEAAGFHVGEAGDPDEGLRAVRSDRPDLVILDVLMPTRYEGFDVARRIREEPDLRDMPILVVSAVHDVKQPPYRFTPDPTYLPVDAFLEKPVPSEQLVRKVNEMLGLQREEPQDPV